MNFAKRLYWMAGLYGLIVLVPQYFLEERFGRDNPPPITHPEFYYGFTGVALAWQMLFLIIAKDPARYRLAMLPAVFEKASFGVAVAVLFFQHRTSVLTLGFGIIDLLLGALFLRAYFKTPAD